MKTTLFFCACLMLFAISTKAQVTQINNNNSLQVVFPLAGNKTILISPLDSSIWVTDATLGGTVQISPDIKFEYDFALLSGKLIFRGSTAATGLEVYITDGTTLGTTLVSDIVSGTDGSAPANFALLGGFVYFTAETAAEGRELWRTNGTDVGTTLVKDIITGPNGAFGANSNELFSNGTYLLFAGDTPSSGVELYKSDGTSGGTDVLKDINPLSSDSSNPKFFYKYNNLVLFVATDADHGEEIWKTDGTTGGTVILKDINDGPPSSTSFDFFGFPLPIFLSFHLFENKLYFNATDGASNGEIWSTDGTEINTVLLKDVVTTASLAFIPITDAVNLPGKFIFPASDGISTSELWESDGTTVGTAVFKSFTPLDPLPPFILLSFDFTGGTLTQPLFQGNKFFFVAGTATEGKELWISDGTLANTTIVKDIGPAANDGIISDISYVFTSTTLFFAADDGTNGNEVWKTDGTEIGTSMVFDINPNSGDADPNLLSGLLPSGKIIFGATDGDDADLTDLYVIDGTFSPLPITLADFTVSLNAGDALLQWSTMQEVNSKDFAVQRSYDAQHFETIGIVQASGTVSNKHNYSFKDAGIINSGKEVAYYRLVTSDKDGKTKNTNIISLKLGRNGKWNVVVLSNPVQDNLKILLTGITSRVQILIRDLGGKTIYANSLQNVNGQISIPAKLQRGAYILTVETNNERKAIQFVKQ